MGQTGHLGHVCGSMGHVGQMVTWVMGKVAFGNAAIRFSHLGYMGYWPGNNILRSVDFMGSHTMVSQRVLMSEL